jgi:hypothetical protein
MAEPPHLPILAEFAPIPRWREISGMSRSKTYEELAAGNLRGVKCGRTVLIDVKHGLEYLRALPPVKVRPRAKPRRRSTPPAAIKPVPLAARLRSSAGQKSRRKNVGQRQNPLPSP